jgi:tRNA(fMet)-specific endonuclease VapC
VTLKYLLDTNVLSEPLRPAPNQHVLDRLQRHQGEIATAAVVWHELLAGCNRLPASARRTVIETYLTQVVAPTIVILPYGARAAEWHAAERVRLIRAGRTPPFADGQIMAIAQVNSLILVTANVADYTAFLDVQIEDWRSPSP